MLQFRIKDLSEKEMNKLIKSAARIKKVSAVDFSGWADFMIILNNYVKSLIDHKANFNLTLASDEQINMLKLYDRDIYLINNFIKKIPMTLVNNLEEEIKKQRAEDEA